jgi:hypothetical protein
MAFARMDRRLTADFQSLMCGLQAGRNDVYAAKQRPAAGAHRPWHTGWPVKSGYLEAIGRIFAAGVTGIVHRIVKPHR